MKVEKMRVVIVLVVVLLFGVVQESSTTDMAAKCNLLVQKVLPCLNFATGQAAVPTKDCCEATSEIKKSDPECLCFAIQQTHKGSTEAKNMGIQEGRLLQLPSACNLKNATSINCPKLLGLSPNSPDAAIFRNASLKTKTTPPPLSDKGSFGNMLRPLLMPHLVIPVLTVIPIALRSINEYPYVVVASY